ncbi:arginine N-succinyltransferase [Sphingomonas sp.]|uniref:arginine N-succinyltransferase n=1 Tax=Sphingomonas sp. TaxID=28214 RepID=UPI003D6D467C
MTSAFPWLRPARPDDVDAVMAMARAAGPGMTNLQPDRDALGAMLAASEARLLKGGDALNATPLWFLLIADAAVIGTAAIFPSVGMTWPFYSYQRNRLVNVSVALDRSVTIETLTLNNDFNGAAEVGGLIVLPQARGMRAGRIAARGRYLFMAEHRSWFPTRVMAELRGWLDGKGRSPVWEGIGRPFYGMDFDMADRFGGRHGNQFIAELGPRYPIYADMLPSAARGALGKPHDDSRAAYEMLLAEGFLDEGYIDIFDGGPQVSIGIDLLRGVRESRVGLLTATDLPPGGGGHLLTTGEGGAFRCTRGDVVAAGHELAIDAGAAERLGVSVGDRVRHVAF